MDTKGAGMVQLKLFVVNQWGQQGFQRFLEALPPESKRIYEKPILASFWFPVHDGLIAPLKCLCDSFYQGDIKGAWDEGRSGARQDLQGIYRVFVKVATPTMLLRNSAMLFGSYYTGATLKVASDEGKRVTLLLAGMDPPSPYLDRNIAGWIHGALELCGCSDIAIAVDRVPEGGAEKTRLVITWS